MTSRAILLDPYFQKYPNIKQCTKFLKYLEIQLKTKTKYTCEVICPGFSKEKQLLN